ncbi:hypothetical protein NDU88_007563 [Pleurodeles waltl]|uniref:Uncharacterized protein n=1 Tax=Pleurodeles waltl TaxID=8319 RepID=A0AAV7U113_PLEWA|nr:hypothetical protein NDU88_007563 [Pleurodeles waltl]
MRATGAEREAARPMTMIWGCDQTAPMPVPDQAPTRSVVEEGKFWYFTTLADAWDWIEGWRSSEQWARKGEMKWRFKDQQTEDLPIHTLERSNATEGVGD